MTYQNSDIQPVDLKVNLFPTLPAIQQLRPQPEYQPPDKPSFADYLVIEMKATPASQPTRAALVAPAAAPAPVTTAAPAAPAMPQEAKRSTASTGPLTSWRTSQATARSRWRL